MKQLIKRCLAYAEYVKYGCLRLLLCVFHLCPVRRNRVLFHSFNGRQYSCNPRAISEALLAASPADYEIVWAFTRPEAFADVLPATVKRVKMHSLSYYYYAKTAGCTVINARGNGEISRRKDQLVIQTWHASNGYKKILPQGGLEAKKNRRACKDFSYVLAGTAQMERERVRKTMEFQGPIIQGTPRMDGIIHPDSDIARRVRETLSLGPSVHIALYAPTYRRRSDSQFGLDYTATLDALQKRFGGEWVLLMRLHYFITTKLEHSEQIIDVTDYPDIQDLLLASDVLFSDYSSCIWDFSFLYRPCFLLCDDLAAYTASVNFNLPIREWGFPLAENNEELQALIAAFQQPAFEEQMRIHHDKMGSFEDGQATARVLEIIHRHANH